MHIKDLLLQYSQEKQTEPLSLDSEGKCHLRIENTFTVSIESIEDENLVYFYALIGPAAVQNKEKLYQRLLSANLYGKDTQGSILALDPLRDEVILYETLPVDCSDYQDFKIKLETFISQVSYWRDFLINFDSRS